MIRVALRTAALVIALAAFVDPTISSPRGVHPEVAIVAARRGDSALAERVAAGLAKRYDVVRGASPSAVATVIAGDALPSATDLITSPVVSVSAARVEPLAIERIQVSPTAHLGSRATVLADIRARGAQTLRAELRANGVVVDRAELHPTSDEHVGARLAAVAADTGVMRFQLLVTANGDSARADALVQVDRDRMPILFYDARPSWSATFTRRALEGDSRFDVTSRVVTSRDISRDVGAPPTRFDDESTRAFDAIFVGAPDALSGSDIRGLDRYLRARGGTAVLLLDGASPPALLEELTGVAHWDSATYQPANAVTMSADDSTRLTATQIAWPTKLPAAAEVLFTADRHPVIWRVPIGAGRLIVSGAVDAWRFRDGHAFDSFWRSIADAATTAALPALSVDVEPGIVAPGDSVDVSVASRDVLLRGSGAMSVAATLDGQPIRLWPSYLPGRLRGAFIAQRQPGSHRLTVTASDVQVSRTIVVDADARQPRDPASAPLRTWIVSRSGVALTEYSAADLTRAIEQVRGAAAVAEPWHPMRSAWWMLPFALTLSAEWWLRRRRGLK